MSHNPHSILRIILLALALLLLAGAARAATPNRAALVVQFGNGSVETRCVEFNEAQITGYDLLTRSGLNVEAAFSPGLGAAVCSIGGEGCSPDACFCQYPNYWSYWIGNADGWTYSPAGVSSVVVNDGSINGWSWGQGNAPPAYTFDDICAPAPAMTDTPTLPSPTPTVILIPTDAPITVTPSPEPSATSTQPSAVSIEPSAVSSEPTLQPPATSTAQPNNPSIGQPNNPSTEQPNNQTTEQPHNRIIHQPNNRTTAQPNNPSTEQPDNRITHQPNNRTTAQPNNQTTGQLTNQYLGFGVLLIGLALALIAAALRGQA